MISLWRVALTAYLACDVWYGTHDQIAGACSPQSDTDVGKADAGEWAEGGGPAITVLINTARASMCPNTVRCMLRAAIITRIECYTIYY